MDNLGYLLADSSRLLRRRFDALVGGHGVTGPQARLLLLLDKQGGQSQNYYAEQTEVEPITLTRMVDRLETAGLVQRHNDPADRRVRKLELTEAGKTRIADLHMCVGDLVDTMTNGLSAAERGEFVRLLERVRTSLAEQETGRVVAHG
ncbi:MAG: MarR family winged helix-turn-helix transcriptional regulator [Sphingomonadaceae bacterium]